MGIIITFAVAIGLIAIIGVFGVIRYSNETKKYDSSIFKLPVFYSIGKLIIDDFIGARYFKWSNKRFIKLKDYYTQLYGKTVAEEYTTAHFYQGMTLSYIVVLITVLASLGAYINYIYEAESSVVEVTHLVRPEFGEFSEEKKYNVILMDEDGGIGETVEYVIEPMEPTEEQIEEAFDTMIVEYDKYFNDLMTQGYINRDFKLPKKFSRYDANIKWTTSDASILTSSGEIKSENVSRDGEAISVSAVFKIDKRIREHSWDLNVLPTETLLNDILNSALKRTSDGLKSNQAKEIEVISEIDTPDEEVEIAWYEVIGEGGNREWPFVILLLGLVMSYLFNRISDSRMQERIAEKMQKIQLDFPVFADKFILYVYCGIAPEQALVKYLGSKNDNSPLTVELKHTLREIEYYGIEPREAFLNFGKRTRVPEVLKFSTLVAQMIKKGDDSIQESLHKLIADSWQEKRKIVLEKGNKASTRLLLPMMILMVLVIIVVLTPAFSAFNGF